MSNTSRTASAEPPTTQHDSSTPLDAGPAKKKKRGPKSALTEDHIQVIHTYFPEMEKLLVKHKLHAGKEDKASDPPEVLAWFDKTIAKILKSQSFNNLDKSMKSPAEWRVVVRDVFKNYRNNTFIPKNQKTFALRYLRLDNTDTRTPDAFSNAADALVSFKASATPKKVFERENKAEIISLMNQKIAAQLCDQDGVNVESGGGGPAIPRGPNSAGLYQNALKELWSQADQQSYTEQAASVDIFKNQAMFYDSMYNSLCALAEGGAIGPAEMLLWVGFRDKENVVQCLRVHAHHRFDPDGNIKSFIESEDTTKVESAWEAFCEDTLPQHPKQSPECPEPADEQSAEAGVLRTTAAGVPVLPEIDFDNTTRVQLSEALTGFRKALWQFSYPPDVNMPSVPVAGMAAHPADYIDIETFPRAVQLATIESLDLLALFSLAKYLGEVSQVHHVAPLTFRSREDIQRRLHSRNIEEDNAQQTGELIKYDSPPAFNREVPSVTAPTLLATPTTPTTRSTRSTCATPTPTNPTPNTIVTPTPNTTVTPTPNAPKTPPPTLHVPNDPMTASPSASATTPAILASHIMFPTPVIHTASPTPATPVTHIPGSGNIGTPPTATLVRRSTPTSTATPAASRIAPLPIALVTAESPRASSPAMSPTPVGSGEPPLRSKRRLANAGGLEDGASAPPKRRKCATAGTVENEGPGTGRATRASTKQAQEQPVTRRLRRGRGGNNLGAQIAPGEGPKTRKGRQ